MVKEELLYRLTATRTSNNIEAKTYISCGFFRQNFGLKQINFFILLLFARNFSLVLKD